MNMKEKYSKILSSYHWAYKAQLYKTFPTANHDLRGLQGLSNSIMTIKLYRYISNLLNEENLWTHLCFAFVCLIGEIFIKSTEVKKKNQTMLDWGLLKSQLAVEFHEHMSHVLEELRG